MISPNTALPASASLLSVRRRVNSTQVAVRMVATGLAEAREPVDLIRWALDGSGLGNSSRSRS